MERDPGHGAGRREPERSSGRLTGGATGWGEAQALERLRLAAALAHAAPDADLEVVAAGRRWLVSYDDPAAAVDPCRFRLFVLAAMRGCLTGLLPLQRLRFVGGLRERVDGLGPEGAVGTFVRFGAGGEERQLATLLDADRVATLLGDCPVELLDGAVEARVGGDAELGTTVVTLTAAHPAYLERLDAVAAWAAPALFVEELLDGPTARAAP